LADLANRNLNTGRTVNAALQDVKHCLTQGRILIHPTAGTSRRTWRRTSSAKSVALVQYARLVDPTPEAKLFDIGAIRLELARLLGVPVDMLTPRSRPRRIRDEVLEQAQPV
jgi:hypothetical protein